MSSNGKQILILSSLAVVIGLALIGKGYYNANKVQEYQVQLKSQIAGTTHIKVVPNYGEINRAFEEKDKGSISKLIENIQLHSSCKGVCACCGDVTIEFYEDDKRCASLSFHHGKNLRWSRNWPADMQLTEASAEYIISWLSKNGVTDIK